MNVTEKRQIIKPGETIVERGRSDFFYCNKATAPFNLKMSDGSSLVMSSRRKIRLNEALDIFYLENPNTAPIEVIYTMGYGDFSDDSMYIDGSIITNEVVFSEAKPQFLTFETEYIEITPSGTAKKMILQNTGSEKITVFGLVVLPMGTLEINYKNPFQVTGVIGNTLTFTEFE